jgi:hypothetical protein
MIKAVRNTGDRACTHTEADVVRLTPNNGDGTGSTDRCLACGAVRYQHSQGGPWRKWILVTYRPRLPTKVA